MLRGEMSSPPASRPATIVDLLAWRAADQPERQTYTFLVDDTDAVSYSNRDLHGAAQRIASALQERTRQGERALLLHPPGFDYIAAFFGCLSANVIAVPAYPPDPTRLSRSLPRLQAIVRDAGASMVLTTTPILGLADSIFAHAPDLEALDWVATDALPAAGAHWRRPALAGDGVAFLQYTSGSTGAPKGVMVSHDNLMANLACIQHVLDVNPATVGVSWLPPYHDMGLVAMILEVMYAGCTTILMSPLAFLERPIRWLRAISQYRGTICGAPNFAYDLCVKRIPPQDRAGLDLSSWRSAGCAAEPVRAETLERFTAAFEPVGFRREAFFPCYGLAEATLIAAGGGIDDLPIVHTVDRRALASDRVVEATPGDNSAVSFVGSGKALPQHPLAIVDPRSRTLCAPDRIGEIWLSGPSVGQGYWNRPDETAETFRASLADSAEGQFLRTGDLGFMRDGELFITGRLKDLIIIRGTNHYAEDIEHTAQSSNPALRRGCGAAFPIEVGAEEHLALVQEVDTRQQPDWQAVIGDIRQAISEHHEIAIHTVVLVPPGSVHKTSSGKIQRRASNAELQAGGFDVVARWRATGRLTG